jgi:hypothetical protein
MKTAITDQSIVDAVVSAYLETGAGVTVAEIAEILKCPPLRVRARFTASRGLIPGIDCREDYRPSYSRDYPSFQTGSHKVWVYSPSKSTLADIIKTLRASRAASVNSAPA